MKIVLFLIGLIAISIAQTPCRQSGPRFTTFNLASEFRSLDAGGNNVANPTRGQVGTALLRLSPVAYEDGISIPRGGLENSTLPSARIISNAVHAFNQNGLPNVDDPVSIYLFTALATFFGQFQDHDFSLTPELPDAPENEFDIVVPAGDAFFDQGNTGMATINLVRFRPINGTGVAGVPLAHPNTITAIIDASNVYGSNNRTGAALRAFVGGFLNSSNLNELSCDQDLPFNDCPGRCPLPLPDPIPVGPTVRDYLIGGDPRVQENSALAAFHTLWFREHNRLVGELSAITPGLSDEVLYQEARKRNSAFLEFVTFDEWLPLFLGRFLPAYNGYDSSLTPQAYVEVTTGAFRFGHTMMANTIFRRDNVGQPVTSLNGDVPLRDAFFADPFVQIINPGIEPMINGLAFQSQMNIDPFIIDNMRNFLFAIPGATGGSLDLISINIQRARELGIGSYNQVRQAVGLTPATSWADVSPDAAIQARLSSAYGPNGVADCDLWACSLSEPIIGDEATPLTFSTLITRQFTELRNGDRFYYRSMGQFSADEVRIIESTFFSDIIIRNTRVQNVQRLAFAHRDACFIGDAPYTRNGPAATTPSATTFVFTLCDKTNAHPQFGQGSILGYTVTGQGEGAAITLTRGTTYTFVSDANCASRLYLTSDIRGIDTPAVAGGNRGSCAGQFPITFTPDASTPNTIYYGSRFQANAGGIINVVNAPTSSASSISIAIISFIALIALFLM